MERKGELDSCVLLGDVDEICLESARFNDDENVPPICKFLLHVHILSIPLLVVHR